MLCFDLKYGFDLWLGCLQRVKQQLAPHPMDLGLVHMPASFLNQSLSLFLKFQPLLPVFVLSMDFRQQAEKMRSINRASSRLECVEAGLYLGNPSALWPCAASAYPRRI